MSNKLFIAWIPPTNSLNSASFRIRVAEIMRGLCERGHTCKFYEECDDPDILIISKKYDHETLMTMERFRSNNKKGRIVFDICDNHFYTDSKKHDDLRVHDEKIKRLIRALEFADAITTPSEYLGKIVASNANIANDVIYTIDDCYERENSNFTMYGFRRLFAEINLKLFQWKLDKINKRDDRFVWFGTHGVSYAEGGMLDLLIHGKEITDALQNSSKSLTIISNSYRKYLYISRSLNIKTYYLSWHQQTVDRALRLHNYLLLPVSLSPFTAAKSTNRPVTAIRRGLMVICDMIPAYEKLRQSVITPVSAKSIEQVLSMSNKERFNFNEKASATVLKEYSLEYVAAKWETVLYTILERKQ